MLSSKMACATVNKRKTNNNDVTSNNTHESRPLDLPANPNSEFTKKPNLDLVKSNTV